MKNVIIDTDPGHDDAMALMLAARSEELNILAVTTAAGNSTIENTTRNARHIIGLLDRSIPVHSGAEKPLKRGPHDAEFIHGATGLAGIDPQNEPKLTGDAVDTILDTLRREEDVTIITLGPLTNIARALERDAETVMRAKDIIMMGGAVEERGNVTPDAEFNIHADPEAADKVFKSDLKKTLVTLDACNHVKLHLKDFRQVKGKLQEPLLKMAAESIERTYRHQGEKVTFMYDPLTVYALLKPEHCITEERNITIDTTDEGRGATRTRQGEPNTTIVKSIDSGKFTDFFIRTLSQSQNF